HCEEPTASLGHRPGRRQSGRNRDFVQARHFHGRGSGGARPFGNGTRRALGLAGARSVVASLWKIEDNATRVMMSEFYRLLWDGTKPIGKAEALRRAQRAMIRHFEPARHTLTRGVGGVVNAGELRANEPLHPFFWAAFTLDG